MDHPQDRLPRIIGRRGLAEQIDKATNGGAELVAMTLSIFRGEPQIVTSSLTGETVEQIPTTAERMAARDWLADRAFGKAPERVHIENAGEEALIDFSALPVEALEAREAYLTAVLDAEERKSLAARVPAKDVTVTLEPCVTPDPPSKPGKSS